MCPAASRANCGSHSFKVHLSRGQIESLFHSNIAFLIGRAFLLLDILVECFWSQQDGMVRRLFHKYYWHVWCWFCFEVVRYHESGLRLSCIEVTMSSTISERRVLLALNDEHLATLIDWPCDLGRLPLGLWDICHVCWPRLSYWPIFDMWDSGQHGRLNSDPSSITVVPARGHEGMSGEISFQDQLQDVFCHSVAQR